MTALGISDATVKRAEAAGLNITMYSLIPAKDRERAIIKDIERAERSQKDGA